MTGGAALRIAACGLLLAMLAACAQRDQVRETNVALGLDPNDSPAELYVRMAEEYYKRGMLDVAFLQAQKAIDTDRRYPRAQIWIAYLYEELKQPERAQQHYDEALRLAPNNSEVRYAYGAYQCRRGHYAEADVEFVRVLASPLYTTPWIAMTRAGLCAAQGGDTAKAERYFRDAVTANPHFGPALIELAGLAYGRGDLKSAKTQLDRFFDPATPRERDETTRKGLELAVTVERALGNRRRATEYERVLKANFSTPPAPRGP